MKRLLGIFVLCLFASADIFAQSNTTRFFIAYDYEDLTVDSTAGGVALTSTKVTNPSNPVETANLITFSVSCAAGTDCPARFTIDGTAPTTTAGILVQYGQIISVYQHDNIVAFRAIRTGATSAVFNVQYFR